MKRLYKYGAGILSALTFLIGGGCTGHDGPDENTVESGLPASVTLTLSARPGNRVGTRADRDPDGTPADPELPNEKIKNWFVVFIDNTGKVAKVLHRSDVETGISITGNPAVEQETFKCILPTGTDYTVYAFANITKAQLKEATGGETGLEFPEGTTLGAGFKSKIASAVWTAELNGWDISKPIPMSGHKENVTIQNTIEETLSIEVVRMVAKVQFLFTNPTDTDITVKSVSLDPVTSTAVSLFPKGSKGIDYSHLGNVAFTPLSDAAYSAFSVPVNCNVEKGAADVPTSFYIKESLSNRTYNDRAFTVGIKVTHNNEISEHQQYNITKDITGYINRNDWIVIPITLSRYDVSVEAIFYPPIGGYPAVLSTTDPDGSQIFTFYTEGEFALVPYVFDKQTGQHLAPQDYKVEIGNISITPSLPLLKNGLTVTQTSSSLPDEIIGEFSSNIKGKASVEVKVTIGSQVYTRNIYIIRL